MITVKSNLKFKTILLILVFFTSISYFALSLQPVVADPTVPRCDSVTMDFFHTSKDQRCLNLLNKNRNSIENTKTVLDDYMRSNNGIELKDEYKVDTSNFYSYAAQPQNTNNPSSRK